MREQRQASLGAPGRQVPWPPLPTGWEQLAAPAPVASLWAEEPAPAPTTPPSRSSAATSTDAAAPSPRPRRLLAAVAVVLLATAGAVGYVAATGGHPQEAGAQTDQADATTAPVDATTTTPPAGSPGVATAGIAAFLPQAADVAGLGLDVDGRWQLAYDQPEMDGLTHAYCLSDGPPPVQGHYRTWSIPGEAEVSVRVATMTSPAEARRAVVDRETSDFDACLVREASPDEAFGTVEPDWTLDQEISGTDASAASRAVVLTGARSEACELTMAMGWRQVQAVVVSVSVTTCSGAGTGTGQTSLEAVGQTLDGVEALIGS